jgi:hypothetical protein
MTISANGSVDVVGGAANLTGGQTHTPSSLTNQVTLLLRQLGAGGATVRMTVNDACGAWQTFAGGGATAF